MALDTLHCQFIIGKINKVLFYSAGLKQFLWLLVIGVSQKLGFETSLSFRSKNDPVIIRQRQPDYHTLHPEPDNPKH
ncbi:MAG: hypothetical protein A2075_00105 [Geobacteraceae bacterium GWC2_58_44]|nr:MAG: hypothetical protein A2075_00105 [Geobacteraceae bacterium GWC2_58_44]HBG06841.1 hypothetical protein [Geobacter sp.]